MKILIVNTNDIQGGAARAAYRLHKALLSQGIDSMVLVQDKVSDDYTVIGPSNKIEKAIAKLRPFFDSLPVRFYKNRTKTLFSPAWLPFSNVVKKNNELNPDIVHLHWIAGGMMRIEDIAKINAPVVWSLHDNWAFTGGCHIKWECEKYKEICGACPRLGSKKENDLSTWVYKRKQKIFLSKKMVIIGLSKWMHECAKSSSLLKDHIHINLPNPIDTTIFKSFDKDKARDLWNLPEDKKLVLFGAFGATNDINKGFRELTEALQKLNKNLNIELVVFGSSQPQNAPEFGFKTHYLGQLHDDISLVTLYNAVDVMVVPSLQENLSNTIMESLACGTPAVAFDVGGNSDMIDHELNGYLARPFDSKDLAKGIEWVLTTPNYKTLSHNARAKVLNNFDNVIVAKKYIRLYEEVMRGGNT